MKAWTKSRRVLLALCMACICLFGSIAYAQSDDNSLYDLGITTEGVTVEPEFTYSTWEYNVTVPAGTTELELSPVPSASGASVSDISGTTLAEDGTSTVYITVTAESGAAFTYTLYVTREAGEPVTEVQTEAQTEPQTEPETETETEDSQYVKVDKNTIQEAEDTITELKGEIAGYRETVSLYTKIMYGLIALSVILLFVVINQILRKRDLKAELNDYRSYGYEQQPKSKKDKASAQPAARKAAQPQQGRPAEKANRQAGKADNGGAQASAARQRSNQQRRTKGNGQQPQQRAEKSQQGYRPDQGLDVRAQSSRKKRSMPEYEPENVVKAAAEQSKAEDAAMRQAQAAKRKERSAERSAANAAQNANSSEKKDVRVDMIDL